MPADRNAKGIALFALAAIGDYRRRRTEESEIQARVLLDALLSMKLDRYSGAAWGYNFDWQSRNFFAARGTATIVPTAFAVRALIEGGQVLRDSQDLQDEARSVCEFILKDLPRVIDNETELCFSYAPNSATRIFNANLLAAEVLACVGKITGESELLESAERATRYVVNNQRADGSWFYGAEPKQVVDR